MSLIELVKKIYHESLFFFLHPYKYWQGIKSGEYKGIFGFNRFFIPGLIVALPSIYLGDFLFHFKDGFHWQDALVTSIRKVIFLFLLLTFSNMIIRFIIKQFRFPFKLGPIKRITAYSVSPALLTMIVTGIFPFLDLGGVAPWYGFYLAYVGFETYYEVPENKKFYFYFALFMGIFSLIMFLSFTLNRIAAHILL